MRNFFTQLGYKLRTFMIGRYGVDKLSNFIMIVSMILLIVSLFFTRTIAGTVLWILALALIIYNYFRVFSKNTSKRYLENCKYLRIQNSITGFFRNLRKRMQDSKTHRYFKCPSCRQQVRVPKGKGKIRISCPRCKTAFIKKT